MLVKRNGLVLIPDTISERNGTNRPEVVAQFYLLRRMNGAYKA